MTVDQHLSFADFQELEQKYLMQTGKHQPLRVVRGAGVHLYDSDGRVSHSLLLELFTEAGIGTMVTP